MCKIRKNDQNRDFSTFCILILYVHYDSKLSKIHLLGPLKVFLNNIWYYLMFWCIFDILEKNRFFGRPKMAKKSKMADFSKNTCRDKMIVLLQDTPSWAPQTPICPLSLPHILPTYIIRFRFWIMMQNEVFFTFWRGVLRDEFLQSEKFFLSKVHHLSFLTHFLP